MGAVVQAQPPAGALPATLGEALKLADDVAAAEKAASTRRNYERWLATFAAWCRTHGIDRPYPATADTVRAFLVHEAGRGLSASSLSQCLAALRHAHKLAGLDSPTDSERVKAVMRGLRRSIGAAPKRKAPATSARIKAMVRAIPADTLPGKRDRALLLLGFGGAFRRSELVALQVDDVVEESDGLRITIRRSKTDQEALGQSIGIIRGSGETCPVRAVMDWIAAAGIKSGPLFRSFVRGGRLQPPRYDQKVGCEVGLTGFSVAQVVKRRAEAAGLDPNAFAGHSLRSGFLTSAAANRADLFRMMDVSRHKSVDMVRVYVREAEIFRDHAGAGLL
jgi:site-specific recombinase XerD